MPQQKKKKTMILKKKRCIKCKKVVNSISPMRKYCFDCRLKMRRVWFENFKRRKEATKKLLEKKRQKKSHKK
ncbi:hypothetical protein HYW21_06590 [Candidatus Woesearchaeota archaeon]|nr:hypothetical protein [Candidatus Woesearchaeota archaeon]